MTPNPSEIRTKLPAAASKQSTFKALAIFLPALAGYCASFVAIALVSPLWLKFALAATNGIFIAVLFIIGHDACHGSFTSHRWLNQSLGRIAFLPSLHPFSSWELGHNGLHHCWTNLRGKDFVWTPLSFEEFRSLPVARQWLERFYRSPFGVGMYYFVEIWCRHAIVPQKHGVTKIRRDLSIFDHTLVLLFLLAQIATLVSLTDNTFLALLTGIVIPQAIWNSVMGFVIFQHHTHPRVRWYDVPEEWSFFAGQVQGTVHVIFPWPIGAVLHNIMEHTAHHINPRIPLYNLALSQRAVRDAYSDDVIQSLFTPRNFLQIMATCQLYDYRNHRWLDFNGKPTTNGPGAPGGTFGSPVENDD